MSPVLQQFPYCTNASSSNHLAWNLFIKPVYFNTRTHGVISLYYQTSVGSVAQSVQRLAMGCTVRGSNPSGGEIFRTCPDRPGAHPASCTMGTGSFPGVKSGGADYGGYPALSQCVQGAHFAGIKYTGHEAVHSYTLRIYRGLYPSPRPILLIRFNKGHL